LLLSSTTLITPHGIIFSLPGSMGKLAIRQASCAYEPSRTLLWLKLVSDVPPFFSKLSLQNFSFCGGCSFLLSLTGIPAPFSLNSFCPLRSAFSFSGFRPIRPTSFFRGAEFFDVSPLFRTVLFSILLPQNFCAQILWSFVIFFSCVCLPVLDLFSDPYDSLFPPPFD